jgi:hypothetical protein
MNDRRINLEGNIRVEKLSRRIWSCSRRFCFRGFGSFYLFGFGFLGLFRLPSNHEVELHDFVGDDVASDCFASAFAFFFGFEADAAAEDDFSADSAVDVGSHWYAVFV